MSLKLASLVSTLPEPQETFGIGNLATNLFPTSENSFFD